MPMGSRSAIIRRRLLPASDPMRWPKRSSSSRRRCSPMPATCRLGASLTPASAATSSFRRRCPRPQTSSARSPPRRTRAKRSTRSAPSTRSIRSSRRCWRSCAPTQVTRRAKLPDRSRPSSPTWNAGAGIRAISARPTWSSTSRIVIGKPSMPTPLLTETMKYITVNPTWHVPPSIVHNEYLPALAQDPTVLDRMGLRVSYSGGGVSIWQPPGPNNALGRIRFNFPNRFLVYQHDTPDKYYFAHEVRAYSHGCMRVQDPAKYAEVLLNIARPQEHWTAARITRMFGSGEQDLQLQPTPIWVHLTYQTAFVDNAGKLQTRRDIYNLDSRTLAAIESGRGGLEAPERKREHELVASTQ